MRSSIAFVSCFFLLLSTAQAAITATGDVSPDDPRTWTLGTYGVIGEDFAGRLVVDDGSELFSHDVNVGQETDVTGTVTVSGAGSIWTNSRNFNVGRYGIGILNVVEGGTVNSGSSYIGFYSSAIGAATISGVDSTWNTQSLNVGYEGSGELNILDGGTVNVRNWTLIGYGAYGSDSSGRINFDNGTLTTACLGANSNQLSGTGTINANGLILDGVDLVFDTSHGIQQTLHLNAADQNITVNLDQTVSGDLGAGYEVAGSMTIREGVSITSHRGYIGCGAGSTGVATVCGAGSTWATMGSLQVGLWGNGELNITEGGSVRSESGYLGRGVGSIGKVTVSGTNSTWHSSGCLNVGEDGTGELNITDGGTVESQRGRIGPHGTVTVDGVDSVWENRIDLQINSSSNSGLNIINGGTVNVRSDVEIAPTVDSGAIFFDNGTLNTNFLGASASQLAGTGTINTNGFILDGVDLNFDASNSMEQTFTLNGPDQDITIHFDGDNMSVLGAGYRGTGSMSISEGAVVECNSGYFGRHSGSFGTLEVTGSGSIWKTFHGFIGYEGSGELKVSGGGMVNSSSSIYVGYGSDSTGKVTVSGMNSLCNSRSITVGDRGTGELNVVDGGTVIGSCKLGADSGSTGTATISGIGSTLTGNYLDVGYHGTGTLNILDGGMVSARSMTWVGRYASASGEIHFDNGTLTTKCLVAGADQLTGIGTINTRSLFADGFDLVFDASHGLQQTFTLTGPNKNIVINLDKDDSGHFGAGYTGTGSVTIRDGLVAGSGYGYIGYHAGSSGVVTVSGVGSSWTGIGSLDIGYYGNGELNITDGGSVDSYSCDIGFFTDAVGKATVSGVGSTLTCNRDLSVGCFHGGTGQLDITDGGVVNALVAFVGSSTNATGTITVAGSGSTLICNDKLYIAGMGQLNIVEGGVVQVGGTAWIAQGPRASIHFQNGTLATASLAADSSQLTGTGTIHTHGLIANEMDLVFDASHSPQQTLTLNRPGQNITINLDQNSTGDLGAGYIGNGSITIRDGVVVEANSGYLGYNSGSRGTATISGAGSTLKMQGDFYVGRDGAGELSITEGGLISIAGDLFVEDDSFINMSSGGMFALLKKDNTNATFTPEFISSDVVFTDIASADVVSFNSCSSMMEVVPYHPNLGEFLDVIRWWDDSISDWAPLTTATEGTDYTLEYPVAGDLAGYAVLTVGPVFGDGDDATAFANQYAISAVPEPGCVALLVTAMIAGGLLVVRKRRRV